MSTTKTRPEPEIYRPSDLAQRLGVHRATLYRWAAAGTLPAPIRLGANSTGWRRSDIDAWLRDRPQA